MKTAAAVLAVLAAATGCKKESAIDKVKNETSLPAQGAGEPVTLAVSVQKPEVALGDDIVFHFKITNTSGGKTTVNVPRLDRRCAEFRFRREKGVGTATRIQGDFSQTGQFIPEAPEVKELAPGEHLESDVRVVAIESGKAAVTATYVRLGSTPVMVAPALDVTVKPADPKSPRLGVKLETTVGDYTAVFRPDVAFTTVESIAALVKRNFYSGLKFHRVIKGFMAQGGDPEGTGGGGPGYCLPLEAPNGLLHKRGVMSMARRTSPVDSAGSQFFILFATRPDLDQGRYSTFAEMVDGEATVKALESAKCTVNPMNPGDGPSVPTPDILIKRASLVELP